MSQQSSTLLVEADNTALPGGDGPDTDPLPRESTGPTTSDAMNRSNYKRMDKTYIGQLVDLQEKMMVQDNCVLEKEDQYRLRQGLLMDRLEQFMHQYVELEQEKIKLKERKLTLIERQLNLQERELRLKYPRLEEPGMPC